MTDTERKLLMTLGQSVLMARAGPGDVLNRVAGLMGEVEREAGIAPNHWFHDQPREEKKA